MVFESFKEYFIPRARFTDIVGIFKRCLEGTGEEIVNHGFTLGKRELGLCTLLGYPLYIQHY